MHIISVGGKKCDEIPFGNADIEPVYEDLPAGRKIFLK